MLYRVLKPFGPGSGKKWEDYVSWIHHEHLESFDSVDSMLRDECFEPETEDDWANCVNEDFRLNFINNLAHARKVRDRNPGSEIVGMDLDFDESYRPSEEFRGFDILDEWVAVSLLSNWGVDDPFFESVQFESNGLIGTARVAFAIRDKLQQKYADDSHAENCQVVRVYRVAG